MLVHCAGRLMDENSSSSLAGLHRRAEEGSEKEGRGEAPVLFEHRHTATPTSNRCWAGGNERYMGGDGGGQWSGRREGKT